VGAHHVGLDAGARPALVDRCPLGLGGTRSGPPTRPSGVQVRPRRGGVERTFAWLLLNRRLSTDDEALPVTSEAWLDGAMAQLMVTRLAQA
jgi:transposase